MIIFPQCWLEIGELVILFQLIFWPERTWASMYIVYNLFFFTSEVCEAIHVTGDTSTSNSEGGLYMLTDERASAAPSSPVWKKSGGNRFIINTGTSTGWRIGPESSLADGSYNCKGK